MMRFTTFSLAALALSAAGAPATGQAAPADTVSGRVLDAEGAGVAGAEVRVRSERTLLLRSTVSGTGGEWRVVFPDTAPRYEVSVTRIGTVPARVQAVRAGSARVRAPDVVLADLALTLPGVTVTGERRRIPPAAAGGDRAPPSDPTAPRRVDRGDQTRFDRASLDEVAALAPGAVVLEDGSVSVGGLDPRQNAVRLNGLGFAGAALPSLARGSAVVTSQTADASRGFGGAEVSVDSRSGLYQSPALTLRFTGVDPAAQLAGPAGEWSGLRRSERTLGLLYEAGLFRQRAAIALAAEAGWENRSLATPAGAGPEELAAFGVAPDSVVRLRNVAAALGIPLEPAGIPDAALDRRVNLLGRVAHQRLPGGVQGSVHLQWDRRERGPAGVGLGTFPGAGRRGVERGWNAGAELRGTTRGGFFHEGGLVRDERTSRSAPYLSLPGARVRVASELPGGEGGIASLRLGGGGGAGSALRAFTEGFYRVHWNSYDDRHRLTLGAEARHARARDDDGGDRAGTFLFHSLAELEAGRPSSYTRLLDAPAREGRLLNGAAFVQDVFFPSDRVEVRLGLRAEASGAGPRGEVPAAVLERFPETRAALPAELRFLPRIGVLWRPAPGISAWRLPPWGEVSAGVAALRAAPEVDQVLLPGGGASLLLHCVGGAVPSPDWAGYAAGTAPLPARCEDEGGAVGGGGTDAPAAFDREMGAPRSWKAHLGWAGVLPLPSGTGRRLRLSFEGQYLRGRGERSEVDLNLDATPRFRLADEGGRPVFVPAGTIVPETGAVPLAPSRRDAAFGTVTRIGAEREVETLALTALVSPQGGPRRMGYSLSYTRFRGRARDRGADPEDPTRLGWAANRNLPAHAVTASLMRRLWRGGAGRAATLHLRARLQSGMPFTPVVAGDVDGDGRWGDAAFVPDPAAAPDPATAEGVRRLLASAPAGAAACLRRQLGRIAAPGSCARPWWVSADAELRAGSVPAAGRFYDVALLFRNLPAAADHLLHGSAGARGWGGQRPVDPVLLSVRGFDPVAERFVYDVNPRFGRAPEGRATGRPFEVELRVTVKLDRPLRQVIAAELVHSLRNEALTAADTAALLREVAAAPHWVRTFAEERWRVRLLLTDDQQRALETLADSLDAARERLADRAEAEIAVPAATGNLRAIARASKPLSEEAHELVHAYLLCVREVLTRDQWRGLGGTAEEVDEEGDTPEARALWCRGLPLAEILHR